MTERLTPASCDSCGIVECPLHMKEQLGELSSEGQAWLLDERWEEFDTYLVGSGAPDPLVLVPWRGRKAAYAWSIPPHARVKAALWLTLQRSWAIRSRGPQGRRQQVVEMFDRRYAELFGRRLSYEISRLVVWQNYLPFLQTDKILGGRQYDVLLWRAPRHVLHQTLEKANEHYPESRTLGDFRSGPDLVEAEQDALKYAHRIVTPHVQLSRLYPEKTILLKWSLPPLAPKVTASKIAFLGPTLGRRGAYMVRSAMKELRRPLVVIGRNLEAENFWDDVQIEERPFDSDWLDDVRLLLAPSLTGFKPQRLIQALQIGVPVIATEACGLPVMENLHLVDSFDAEGLAEKISALVPN